MPRSPSRTRTPPSSSSTSDVAPKTPTSLLVAPNIRSSPSLSNLHIHSPSLELSNILPVPSIHTQSSSVLDSTASSVINLDLNEGILVHDGDVEKECPEEINVTTLESNIQRSDEASKRTLRDHLRRTLSHATIRSGGVSRYTPRQYFVLTDAGKPVFVSRPDGEDSGNTAATVGVMQALISVFLDDNDKMRCINAGRTRISFVLRPPLYYACSSSWGEPESVTRSHLEYLHLQILSIVTAVQLRRIFERRTNFDLGRLLNGVTGAENLLSSLLIRLELDLSMSTSSLQCLKLDSNLRKRAAEALLPPSKLKGILYIILMAEGKVITLIRPKKHSIHPADIHITLNTIHSPSVLNSPASSSWIPLCLPKYNSSSFVNAYISFLCRNNEVASSLSQLQSEDANSKPTLTTQEQMVPPYMASTKLCIALVCISGGGDVESIRGWCEAATTRLEKDGMLDAIINACSSGQIEYSVGDLVQITTPTFEDPYGYLEDRRRLITLYQILHDAIHAKSGQEGTLKLQYIRTEKESVMGWITQPFELYIALSPMLPKAAAVGAANAVARWVKKEEAKLFLRDAPVF
ncbi:Vacuolar fusion protein MON1 [Termitomyces sp. J132]|nr:Vacuolar fusion protein MON1 [Termitomyces sp. J132]